MKVTRIPALLAAAALAAAAQTPKVGDINLYGLHRVSAAKVLEAAGLKTGAPLPGSKGDMEERIEELPDVVLSRIEAVCCQGPDAIVFVGVEEKNAPHAAFRSAPSGDATLPHDLAESYRAFLAAVQRAAGSGDTGEDLSAGHSLMADPGARALQEQFLEYASAHLDEIRKTLHDGSEPEERAIAAAVIGYAPNKDKKDVVNDLQYALTDPEEDVRANALRSLKAFAVLAVKDPKSDIVISPTWLVELLHSIVLSDRTGAVDVLLALTDLSNPDAIQLLRERALPDLAEMARWKTLRYALPPFLLIGRVSGLPDDQIHEAWEKGDRDSVIAKALATQPARRR